MTWVKLCKAAQVLATNQTWFPSGVDFRNVPLNSGKWAKAEVNAVGYTPSQMNDLLLQRGVIRAISASDKPCTAYAQANRGGFRGAEIHPQCLRINREDRVRVSFSHRHRRGSRTFFSGRSLSCGLRPARVVNDTRRKPPTIFGKLPKAGSPLCSYDGHSFARVAKQRDKL